MGRAGTILLVIFETFFLNVVVPAHTRGVVTVPGTAPAPACISYRSTGCCPSHQSAADGGRGEKTPSPEQQSRCAICFFAASLSTPPAFADVLDSHGLCDVAPVAELHGLVARHVLLPY